MTQYLTKNRLQMREICDSGPGFSAVTFDVPSDLFSWLHAF